jgi:L-fucose isomerase
MWMDLTNTLSGNKWNARPAFVEGTDRPIPLLHLINGGEDAAKKLCAK